MTEGTPEQVHLTWGEDPSTTVVVSWACPGPAVGPRVLLTGADGGTRPVPARPRAYTDGVDGATVFTYHARLSGLAPGSSYTYSVTADNDGRAGGPFTASFHTAPAGRAPFRFTSFGDLGTPNTRWRLSYGQSAYAVDAVEAAGPLFHLLNGDLCYANLNPAHHSAVWRDFASNTQRSAAQRPWMPCPGNHEVELGNGPQGMTSYLTRYVVPDNGVSGFRGHWYAFKVGAVLFVSLDANDVVYQDGAAFVTGPGPVVPVASTGNPPMVPGTTMYIRGYSGGAQTAWLRRALQAARADRAIDWVIVQLHQDALSSSASGNGSDLGLRQEWLPLFDRYQVDLVLCGHDHDYERSWPVRGFDRDVGTDALTGRAVDTMRPRPVMGGCGATDVQARVGGAGAQAAAGEVFDTSRGTVHLILGCGGSAAPLNEFVLGPSGRPQAKVVTRRNHPMETSSAGVWDRPGADAREDAIWSARRDTATGYGLAVFDVDPGTEESGETSITVTYAHALGAGSRGPKAARPGVPSPDYTVLETFTLVRPRSDVQRRGPSGAWPQAEPAPV